MNRLFADTFFFFAFLNADDSAHREASTFYDAFDGQLVTTEWVLTELADGLSGVSDRQVFIDFHRALRNDPMEREGLTDALTGDRHFEQAGFKVLLSN